MANLRKVIIIGAGGVRSDMYKKLWRLADKYDLKIVPEEWEGVDDIKTYIGEPFIKAIDNEKSFSRKPIDYSKLLKEAKPFIEPKGSKYHK